MLSYSTAFRALTGVAALVIKSRWICAFVFVIGAGSVRADFNDGVIAHMKGDYATALQTLLPLAQTAQHALAQYYVGVIYANGQGTQQNLQEAGKWFKAAAKQGVVQAQLRLGKMYASGKGVPVDLERAYAWLSVAKQRGQAKAQSTLDEVSTKLASGDISAAKKLADEYWTNYGKAPETTAEQHP
jgi:uncharacterized protein